MRPLWSDLIGQRVSGKFNYTYFAVCELAHNNYNSFDILSTSLVCVLGV